MANQFQNIDYLISQNPTLESLYYMLCDYADFGAMNDELEKQGRVYESKQQTFEASMSQEQRALYKDLVEDWYEGLNIYTKQAFIFGYKVAMKLLHES